VRFLTITVVCILAPSVTLDHFFFLSQVLLRGAYFRVVVAVVIRRVCLIFFAFYATLGYL